MSKFPPDRRTRRNRRTRRAFSPQATRLEPRQMLTAGGWLFDFGTATSPVANGYTGVSDRDTYDPQRGYGWTAGTVTAADAGGGSDLTRDAVQGTDATFAADLLPGRYRLTLVVGDGGGAAHDDIAVSLQGDRVGRADTDAYSIATLQYLVDVNSGQLSLRLDDLGGQATGFSIQGLIIAPASDAPPPSPSGVAAEPISTTSIAVSWIPLSGVQDYIVERSTDALGWTQIRLVTDGSSSFQDDAAEPGTAYSYRIYASDPNGPSAPSEIATATTPLTSPYVLTIVNIHNDYNVDKVLVWPAMPAPADDYIVERNVGGGDWATEAILPADTSRYALPPLTVPGTTYQFRVRSIDDVGAESDPTDPVSMMSPPAVTSPTGLHVAGSSPYKIDLSWDAVPNATQYIVERCMTNQSGDWKPVGWGFNWPSWSDYGVSERSQYYYRVIALNAASQRLSPSIAAYVPGHTPRIAAAATASPADFDLAESPLAPGNSSVSTRLSVLGDVEGGESKLIYYWGLVSSPEGMAREPSIPSVPNPNSGNNFSKNIQATFYSPGTYVIRAFVSNYGIPATSDVTVTVHAVPPVKPPPTMPPQPPAAKQIFTNINYSIINYPDADDPVGKIALDVSALVGDPSSSNGLRDAAITGMKARWWYDGPNGSLESAATESADGIAVNRLTTSGTAGDVFYVYATIDALSVDGGPMLPYTSENGFVGGDPILVAGLWVGRGAPNTITFDGAGDGMPADGTSTRLITITATDSRGNPVPDGTPVLWDLDGSGTLLGGDQETYYGQASIRVRVGLYAETQKLTATVGGLSSSADVASLPVVIRFAATKGALTLGTGEEATFTATVRDTAGHVVPDGTPIDWFVQKGSLAAGTQMTIKDGKAELHVMGLGGSQLPGAGYVRAYVGDAVAEHRMTWIAPASQGLSVTLQDVVLAGDATSDGTLPVEQADGSSADYAYKAKTIGTIQGDPGATVILRVPDGMPISLSDDGVSVVRSLTLTLDQQGRATFPIASLGGVPADQVLRVPIQATMLGGLFDLGPPASAKVEVALLPAETIVGLTDFVVQMGWGVVTGSGDSAGAIVGDLAFGMIPVVGALTDVRDIVIETAKFWPGGESPSLTNYCFSTLGLAASFGGNFLKPVIKSLKTLLNVVDRSTPLFRLITKYSKGISQLSFDKIDELYSIFKILSSNPRIRYLAERGVVVDDESLGALSRLVTNLGDDGADVAADLLERIVGSAKKGSEGGIFAYSDASRVVRRMGDLTADQLSTLKDSGNLEYLAVAAAYGMDKENMYKYLNYLENLKSGGFVPLPFGSDYEASIDLFLYSKGVTNIRPNLLSHEVINSAAGRQADRIIDGFFTDYKGFKEGGTISDLSNEIVRFVFHNGKLNPQGNALLMDLRNAPQLNANDYEKAVSIAIEDAQKLGLSLSLREAIKRFQIIDSNGNIINIF